MTKEERKFMKRINEDKGKLKELLKKCPTSEEEVRRIFDVVSHFFGFRIIHYNNHFPDYLLLARGKEIRAEAELKATNFIAHKHDPTKCDLIICWENDLLNVGGLGVDVFELSSHRLYKKDGTIEEIIVKV